MFLIEMLPVEVLSTNVSVKAKSAFMRISAKKALMLFNSSLFIGLWLCKSSSLAVGVLYGKWYKQHGVYILFIVSLVSGLACFRFMKGLNYERYEVILLLITFQFLLLYLRSYQRFFLFLGEYLFYSNALFASID